MMRILKNIVLTIILFSSMSNMLLSQTIDQKNLVSIIHLESNENLKKEIASFFKIKFSKKTNINYQISKKVSFINIEMFKNELKCCYENLSFDYKELDQKGKFKEKYFFESEENSFQKVLPANSNGLIIHFSKPIGNLLIVELSNHDFDLSPIKLGKGLQIIFLFNNEGFVDRVFTKALIHN